jgi:hypothetical protein
MPVLNLGPPRRVGVHERRMLAALARHELRRREVDLTRAQAAYAYAEEVVLRPATTLARLGAAEGAAAAALVAARAKVEELEAAAAPDLTGENHG